MTDNPSIDSLRDELSSLRGKLRHNERVWAGFREIEVRLISAASPLQIMNVLTGDMPRIFPRIARVSLAYIETERELCRLLSGRHRGFIELPSDELHALFPPPHRPRLGPCPEMIMAPFFRETARPASAAFVPLVLRGRLVGSLNQMSRESRHFNPSDGTDLLEHLAAVLAMCLENALGHERLKREGLTDPLTGIANRRMLDGRLREETERSARRSEPLSCLLGDIDHFKVINDRFGHAIGDEVLRTVAAAIAGELRVTDVLARYGGEEFVVLLPGTNRVQAEAIAERVRTAVAALEPVMPGGARQISISLGVSCLDKADRRNRGGRELLRRADNALYAAKAAGRNCIRYAGAETDAPIRKM